VSRYLVSAAGVGTSDRIATKMLSLEPDWLGLAQEPLLREIHATRTLLEELEILASERDGPWDTEESGIRKRPQGFVEKTSRSKFE
jgi:hypothetical protein